jgi:hypothetical protein
VEKVAALAWIRRLDSRGIDGQNQWNRQVKELMERYLKNSVYNLSDMESLFSIRQFTQKQ